MCRWQGFHRTEQLASVHWFTTEQLEYSNRQRKVFESYCSLPGSVSLEPSSTGQRGGPLAAAHFSRPPRTPVCTANHSTATTRPRLPPLVWRRAGQSVAAQSGVSRPTTAPLWAKVASVGATTAGGRRACPAGRRWDFVLDTGGCAPVGALVAFVLRGGPYPRHLMRQVRHTFPHFVLCDYIRSPSVPACPVVHVSASVPDRLPPPSPGGRGGVDRGGAHPLCQCYAS